MGFRREEGTGTKHLALPLSFTLPGYRESLRRLSFVCAIRWGMVLSLFLFSFTWDHLQMWRGVARRLTQARRNDCEHPRDISLNLAGTFLVGMVICLVWVNSVLMWSRQRWLVLLFAGVVVALEQVAAYGVVFRHAILCAAVIPPSVFLCGFFWRHLGDMEWVKRGHRGALTHETEGPRVI